MPKPKHEFAVGDRLIVVEGLAYTGPRGGGFHKFRLLVEVDEVTTSHVHWRTVKVLKETGRPDPADGEVREAAQVGGFHRDAVDVLVEEGLLELAA